MNAARREKKEKKEKELNRLVDVMQREISDPSKYEDWVKKYKINPELKQELDKVVSAEIVKREEGRR